MNLIITIIKAVIYHYASPGAAAYSRDMANLRELQTNVEAKINTLHLAERESQRIIKKDEEELQQHLQLFQKRFEEIHEMKYEVQKMMIESNTNEEAIDKWTAELNDKLEKMEQPMADIEEAIKIW